MKNRSQPFEDRFTVRSKAADRHDYHMRKDREILQLVEDDTEVFRPPRKKQKPKRMNNYSP